MTSLLTIVITCTILGLQFHFGRRKSKLLGAIIPTLMTALFIAMSLLDKIVYVADYIEPRRNKAPNLTEVRKLAFLDLDEALYKILSDTLEYLDEGSGEIDQMTMRAYEYYKAKQVEQESRRKKEENL